MTHHLKLNDFSFANRWINIVLIRDPKDSITSFSKVISNPTIDDLGYKLQYDLVKFFKKNKTKFKVVSSENLLKNPKQILMKLCKFSNIKFDSKMLSWQKGGIAEDGVWAKYWYQNVHLSKGFKPYIDKSNNEIIEKQNTLFEQANYYYSKLSVYLKQ